MNQKEFITYSTHTRHLKKLERFRSKLGLGRSETVRFFQDYFLGAMLGDEEAWSNAQRILHLVKSEDENNAAASN